MAKTNAKGTAKSPASKGKTGTAASRAASSSQSRSSVRRSSEQRPRAYVKNARAQRESDTSARSSRRYDEYDDERLKMSYEKDDSLKDEIITILIVLLGALLVLSYFNICGSFGNVLNGIVFGLMGTFGYVFPFAMMFVAIFAIANKHHRSIGLKIAFFFIMMMFIAALIQLAAGGFNEAVKLGDYYTNSVPGFAGENKTYGGLFGGMICRLLCPFMGNVAAALIMVAAVIICFLLIVGRALFTNFAKQRIADAEKRRERERLYEEERLMYEEEYEDDVPELREREAGRRKQGNQLDIDDEKYRKLSESGLDDEIFDEEYLPKKKKKRGSFMDSLMRQGMGLEMDRIGDTPEYQEMIKDYGVPADNEGKIVSIKQDTQPEAEEVYDEADDVEDVVEAELNRKFAGKGSGSNSSETVNGPGVSKQGLIRVNMVDEPTDQELEAIENKRREAEERARAQAKAEEEREIAELQAAQERKAEEARKARLAKEEEERKAALDAARNQDSDDDGEQGDSPAEPLNERSGSGATSFTTPEQLEKLRRENEKKEALAELQYVFPPIDLLTKGQPVNSGENSTDELNATVDKLQRTFESFGVGVKVTDATIGPTVTRYELLPDQGVKVKTITSLADDIKLALAAAEIRIEAPIPGKAAVGIEVPNSKTSPVLLRDLIDSPEFRDAHSSLNFAVGKDIGGKTICFDIAGMPHMLIAGATGSGKSVCINALILSILYKAKPSDVKMIMIDPKRVELVGYNGIPHLLVPVVTDVKKATGALNWAIAEMDDRYERFANAGVNNLKSYNRLMEEKYYEEGNEGECPDRLPQILIIVDELNDLMMTANSKEVEGAICRLTQLARASGIHVVLATQRPSVNVITGTIKANIPSRIAFSVSSIVDSRTIIDQAGAEKLLGKGDMLFSPQGYPKPVRLQGAYVSDREIASVVDFIKSKCKEVKYSDAVSSHIERNLAADPKASGSTGNSSAGAAPEDDGHDEFFAAAGRYIIEKQKASIGMLQRIYKIGFNRAARIMDQLADEGVVGPEEGTKPRKILMTLAEFDAYINGNDPAEEPAEDFENTAAEEFDSQE